VVLRQAIAIAPGDWQTNYLLGAALLQSGRPADAIGPLRIAADATDANPAAEGYLGDAEMETKQFALAAKTFQRAVLHRPDSEEALVWWTNFSLERYRQLMFALRASTNGRAALLQVAADNTSLDLKQAQSLLSQAAGMNPHLDGIWGESGIAQARLAMQTEAATSLEKARQLQPEAISTLELESMVDAARHDWPHAETLFLDLNRRSVAERRKFLASWPRDLLPDPNDSSPAARCMREGSEACDAALPQQAVEDDNSPDRLYEQGQWEHLVAIAPPEESDTTNWFHRGIGYAKLGRCVEAIPALESGLTAGAERAAARLANCYQIEAERAADRLQAGGRQAAVHKIRGDILLSIRLDPSHALTEYSRALELKPKDPEILEKQAEAYYSLGHLDQARQIAQDALQQNPHRLPVIRLLVDITMSERDYRGALMLLDKLAALAPSDAWVRVEQATAYAQTGRAEEAVDRLQPALDAGYADEKGALHAMLASQFRKLGRIEEAKRASDEAVRLSDSYQQHIQSPASQ
jgi:tetratricopeptide (TPR) repeat protein